MTKARDMSRLGNTATILDAIDQELTVNDLQVGDITYPTIDGTSGQVVATDGSGNLSFVSPPSSSGISIQVYNSLVELRAVTTMSQGDIGFVSSTNKLYMYTGSDWFNIGLLNVSPTITTGGDFTYNLSLGTPLEITLSATTPDDFPITWSYEVVQGSLTNSGGTTATITQNDNVFTITPTNDQAYRGYFKLEFTATTNSDSDTTSSYFKFNMQTLLFTLDNPNMYGGSLEDYFGYSVAISPNGNYAIVGAYGEDDAGSADSGKAYIFNPATGQLLWTLDDPNAYSTGLDDNFGYSVAISNNYAIVGAYQEDSTPSGSSSGKAYIFNPATGALLWTLDNPNAYSTSLNDNFGYSVAISDNYAIVGAYQEDDAGGTQSGKAYIFNPATGALLSTIDNPNAYSTSAADNFGSSVAISNNYAIVGARYEDDAGGTNSGKAYIFNPSTGQLLWTLDNPNAYASSGADNFGSSVAISDNYAIVGAYQEDSTPSGVNSGKAYIFNPSTGALLWTLDNPNAYSTSASDTFGYSVAISDNYAIVGAYLEDDAGGTSSGKAYIFNPATGALLWTLDNPNAYSTGLDDNFGYSVAISDNYAIVGASNEDDAGGASSGAVYTFNTSTGMNLYTLENFNAVYGSLNDFFGYSVAISNNYAIVGAYGEDEADGSGSGKAYIFNPVTGQLLWTLNNPNAYGTSFSDSFGRSVAISPDGNYAIVGAYQEDDAGGGASGKAYIFNPATGALLWTLNNPNAYSTSLNDYFGWSVAISNNYAIVGAYQEDDSTVNIDSGKAYIFNPATGQLLWTLNNPNAYDTSAADRFGWSVAISDNYAIVGANDEDDAGGTSSGKAYIFNPATGALLWTLNNPNAYGTSTNDNFGEAVAISDNYAIVGAWQEDSTPSGANSGKAYIFNPSTGALLWTLDDPNAYGTSATDNFGYSVAISNNYVMVGAPNEDDAGGASSGKAYIFTGFN